VPTWKLTIEYDGTRYRGWQSQKNTDRTVQGVLVRAARELFSGPVTIGGAGRTDAGVHALGQVAHLKVSSDLSGGDILWGLNERLPFDVNILEAVPAAPRFDARHDALSRTYLYRISRRRTALEKRFVWWVKDRLNSSAIASAAALFAGRHDFASFCENPEGRESTIVVVEASEVAERGHEIHYRVRASHFLWKMVRRLVGTLVEVGRGNLTPSSVEQLVAKRSKEPAGWTAPPSGLFLESVKYPPAR